MQAYPSDQAKLPMFIAAFGKIYICRLWWGLSHQEKGIFCRLKTSSRMVAHETGCCFQNIKKSLLVFLCVLDTSQGHSFWFCCRLEPKAHFWLGWKLHCLLRSKPHRYSTTISQANPHFIDSLMPWPSFYFAIDQHFAKHQLPSKEILISISCLVKFSWVARNKQNSISSL